MPGTRKGRVRHAGALPRAPRPRLARVQDGMRARSFAVRTAARPRCPARSWQGERRRPEVSPGEQRQLHPRRRNHRLGTRGPVGPGMCDGSSAVRNPEPPTAARGRPQAARRRLAPRAQDAGPAGWWASNRRRHSRVLRLLRLLRLLRFLALLVAVAHGRPRWWTKCGAGRVADRRRSPAGESCQKDGRIGEARRRRPLRRPAACAPAGRGVNSARRSPRRGTAGPGSRRRRASATAERTTRSPRPRGARDRTRRGRRCPSAARCACRRRT